MSSRQQYNGPAPPPSRSVVIGSQPETAETVGEAQVTETNVIDRESLTPGIDRNETHSITSPSPDDQEEAAQTVGLEARIGELIQALGRQKEEYDNRMSELEFGFQARLAAMQPTNGNGAALPAGVDPEAPVTVGQLGQVLTNFGTLQEARMIRASAAITLEEESGAIAKYPYLNSVPEPRKSELLKEAVLRMRPRPNGVNSDSRITQAKAPQAPRVMRPATRTVPHMEASAPDYSAEEPRSENAYQMAIRDYQTAGQIENPKERMRARKAAMTKARIALGMSEEEFAQQGWAQR